MMAWEDASRRALIERVKDQFDPSGLLAPGRLPGVAQPRGLTPQGLASPFSCRKARNGMASILLPETLR